MRNPKIIGLITLALFVSLALGTWFAGEIVAADQKAGTAICYAACQSKFEKCMARCGRGLSKCEQKCVSDRDLCRRRCEK